MMEFTSGGKLDLLSKLQRSLGESSVEPSIEFKEIDGVIIFVRFAIATKF
jgi:hypothetical protein